jgi:2'-5' RNA ligase
MMRLFIGLGLSDDAKGNLWNTVSGMRIRGQLTPKENYHLTLAFLGMREERQVKPIERTVAAAAREHPPQALTVKGLGFFGRRENALLYAKLAPSQPLSALSDTLRRLLTESGEAFDPKPFVPHITLARKADLTAAGLNSPFQPIPFSADKLTLYHSTRIQGELRYIPIFEAAFKTG